MTDKSEEQLQAEIRELREELGQTVQALAYKADVPHRVRDRAAQLRDQTKELVPKVRATVQESSSRQWTVLAVALGLLVAILGWRAMRDRCA